MESPPNSTVACDKRTSAFHAYACFLWAFSLLFLIRIVGQLIQQVDSVLWLPPLAAWQGSSLPYAILLPAQLIIWAAMICTSHRHASGRVKRSRTRGKWLLLLGGLYFLSMTTRLVVGIAGLSTIPWFQKSIPAFFHLVLAAFILSIAAFHMNWLGKTNEFDRSESLQ